MPGIELRKVHGLRRAPFWPTVRARYSAQTIAYICTSLIQQVFKARDDQACGTDRRSSFVDERHRTGGASVSLRSYYARTRPPRPAALPSCQISARWQSCGRHRQVADPWRRLFLRGQFAVQFQLLVASASCKLGCLA